MLTCHLRATQHYVQEGTGSVKGNQGCRYTTQ